MSECVNSLKIQFFVLFLMNVCIQLANCETHQRFDTFDANGSTELTGPSAPTEAIILRKIPLGPSAPVSSNFQFDSEQALDFGDLTGPSSTTAAASAPDSHFQPHAPAPTTTTSPTPAPTPTTPPSPTTEPSNPPSVTSPAPSPPDNNNPPGYYSRAAESSQEQRLQYILDIIISSSQNSETDVGNACVYALEEILNKAAYFMNTNGDMDHIEALLEDIVQQKQLLERTLQRNVNFCNRTRLMACDRKTRKCVCAPNTDHRYIPQQNLISSHCYVATGACDVDAATIIPMLPSQQKDVRAYYGDPKSTVHLPGLCLPNLCVKTNQNKRTCEGNRIYRQGSIIKNHI